MYQSKGLRVTVRPLIFIEGFVFWCCSLDLSSVSLLRNLTLRACLFCFLFWYFRIFPESTGFVAEQHPPSQGSCLNSDGSRNSALALCTWRTSLAEAGRAFTCLVRNQSVDLAYTPKMEFQCGSALYAGNCVCSERTRSATK